jgi:hypothetical protein
VEKLVWGKVEKLAVALVALVRFIVCWLWCHVCVAPVAVYQGYYQLMLQSGAVPTHQITHSLTDL